MQAHEQIALPRLSRTIEEIRASVFTYVESVQDALSEKGFLPRRLNLNKGVVRGILEIFCWGYWQIYSLLQRLMLQVAPAFATGEWLDLHVSTAPYLDRPIWGQSKWSDRPVRQYGFFQGATACLHWCEPVWHGGSWGGQWDGRPWGQLVGWDRPLQVWGVSITSTME